MSPIIITDLDNTIYNWVDYFAPSFRAMVHALARVMSLDEEVLIKDFRQVYARRQSLEYSYSVQELSACADRSVSEVAELVRTAKGAFSHVRSKNLKPYDGVKDTLMWATERDIRVVGVTNAPIFHANQRLKQLHLDGLFHGLAGWKGHEPTDEFPWTREIRERKDAGGYRSKVERFWSLEQEELKPSPFAYLRIISDLHVSHKITYVVGDSLQKDIAPAIDIGAIGVWAKYGENFEKKNFDTLLKITHWSDDKVEEVYNNKSFMPTHTIHSFSELTGIVQPAQFSLFST